MRGIVVPERTEDFTADPVELFFDLVFVFAFSQLVAFLVHNHDWAGVGRAALLFLAIWLPWAQFTWLANAVSGNGRVVRALFLLATVASVPMAASVGSAYGAGGPWFAWSISTILVLGLATMILGMETGSDEYLSAVRFGIPTLVAAAFLVVGSYVRGDTRVVVWIGFVLIVIGSTIAAGQGTWVVRSGHFAERHGLIVIVALGEVIVAVGLPVVETLTEGEGPPARTVITLVASASFACLLWWGYFDRPVPAFEHRSEQLQDQHRSRFARDVYTYAHAPIVAGIILAAAALEEITLHPDDRVPVAFKLMLSGGLALYLIGVVIAAWRSYGVIARERLATAAVLAALIAMTGALGGMFVVIAVDLVLLAMLAIEHLRVEDGPSVNDEATIATT